MNERIKKNAALTLHSDNLDQSLYTYYINFDIDDNNNEIQILEQFVRFLMNEIPTFAFGFHQGTKTSNSELLDKLIDAAKSIYKIESFREASQIYLSDLEIADSIENKYLKRGEFGELILHYILTYFFDALPLISKIYFKDSYGHAVHGFDSVFIQPDTKVLFLGESKLYTDGKAGVRELIKDLENHFNRDFIDSEFSIIKKKLAVAEIEHEDIDTSYWIERLNTANTLSDRLCGITIPLFCAYDSQTIQGYPSFDNKDEFFREYSAEVQELFRYFNEHNNHKLKNRLNVIVILMPLGSKKQLVKALHTKLYRLQELGG